jgi:hypothetical protein
MKMEDGEGGMEEDQVLREQHEVSFSADIVIVQNMIVFFIIPFRLSALSMQ